MGRNVIDITGNVYGILTVVNRSGSDKYGKPIWSCKCECGVMKDFKSSDIKYGRTKSCGCNRGAGHRTNLHHKINSPEYYSWMAMKSRCDNLNAPNYKNYGGRGITYQKSWALFSEFYNDMGDRHAERTLDRVDSNGNYEIGNCRWATHKGQQRNRRNNKLNDVAVRVIRYLYKAGRMQKDLAKTHNITQGEVSRIVNNKQWV